MIKADFSPMSNSFFRSLAFCRFGRLGGGWDPLKGSGSKSSKTQDLLNPKSHSGGNETRAASALKELEAKRPKNRHVVLAIAAVTRISSVRISRGCLPCCEFLSRCQGAATRLPG